MYLFHNFQFNCRMKINCNLDNLVLAFANGLIPQLGIDLDKKNKTCKLFRRGYDFFYFFVLFLSWFLFKILFCK